MEKNFDETIASSYIVRPSNGKPPPHRVAHPQPSDGLTSLDEGKSPDEMVALHLSVAPRIWMQPPNQSFSRMDGKIYVPEWEWG